MLSQNLNHKSDSNTQKKSISSFRRKLYFKNQGKDEGSQSNKHGGGQQSLSVTRANNGRDDSFMMKAGGANLNKTVIGNEKNSLGNGSAYDPINEKAINHNMQQKQKKDQSHLV